MFSLDFNLFHDNAYMIVSILIFYIIFTQNIITYLLIAFKSKKVIFLSITKNLYFHKMTNKNTVYMNYVDSYNSLMELYFVSETKPVLLNYSYIRK